MPTCGGEGQRWGVEEDQHHVVGTCGGEGRRWGVEEGQHHMAMNDRQMEENWNGVFFFFGEKQTNGAYVDKTRYVLLLDQRVAKTCNSTTSARSIINQSHTETCRNEGKSTA